MLREPQEAIEKVVAVRQMQREIVPDNDIEVVQVGVINYQCLKVCGIIRSAHEVFKMQMSSKLLQARGGQESEEKTFCSAHVANRHRRRDAWMYTNRQICDSRRYGVVGWKA